ncbi:MAG: type II toxin-antitoxin system VapC family toxin [Acidobacteriota bacterium]|nr:type II toxin-antitoxin system VapC family toxin [Acidobacteriota bacterium]
MARRYLLDTNIVSHMFRKNPTVLYHLGQIPFPQIAISAVTEGELLFGIARRPEATRLKLVIEEFLVRVAILPWDSDAARHYAKLRAEIEREGRPMGSLDMMIAAQALSAVAVLVTNDKAFSHIRQLKIEDWTRGPQK